MLGQFHCHCKVPVSLYLDLTAHVCQVIATATEMYMSQKMLTKIAQEIDSCSKSHELTSPAHDVPQELHAQHTCSCRNILAVVGPPGSGKSALVAAMCGRLYQPAKATGKILISGKEAYESFKPTWFSANDVLTSHLTVHQYLLYKGTCPCGVDHLACLKKGCSMSHCMVCTMTAEPDSKALANLLEKHMPLLPAILL